ncbi:MAG: hypothetical protein ACON3Z_17670 [Bradymonadia bacterium]
MLRCAYWLLALLVLPMQNVALAEDNASKDKSAVDEAESPKKELIPAAIEGDKPPVKAKAAPAKKQNQKANAVNATVEQPGAASSEKPAVGNGTPMTDKRSETDDTQAETTAQPKDEADEQPDAASALIDGSVAASARKLSVFFSTTYSQLAIADDDPENDRSLMYWIASSLAMPVKGLRLHLDGGLTERFSVEPGESAFEFEDTAPGVSYGHALLDGNKLRMLHRLDVWLPSSRISRRRDLVMAPTLNTNGSFRAIGPLTLTYRFFGQYRWHKYAETESGLAMNTQWLLGQRLGFIVRAFSHKNFGSLSVAGATGFNWSRRYTSRDSHMSPSSDPHFWHQTLGWGLSLQYVPLGWLVTSIGVRHGAPVRRNGIVNPTFVHRDMTTLNLGFAIIY